MENSGNNAATLFCDEAKLNMESLKSLVYHCLFLAVPFSALSSSGSLGDSQGPYITLNYITRGLDVKLACFASLFYISAGGALFV